MRIDAYIDNPVISNQQEYYELLELLEEIDPQCNSVQLRQEVVIIENIARRTFKYPRNPTSNGLPIGCTWSKMGCKYLLHLYSKVGRGAENPRPLLFP